MPKIYISVRNKVAKNVHNDTYICGNSDFKAVFDFDTEWNQFNVKTARIKHDGVYQDIIFTGNECPLPIIENTYKIYIGVFAGNLSTTTPALVVASKSILCGDEPHEEPSEDVYNQIIKKIDSGMLKGPKGDKGDPGIPYSEEFEALSQQVRKDAQDSQSAAKAAQAAANTMAFVSMELSLDGALLINQSENLGSTAFRLNDGGNLEVEI